MKDIIITPDLPVDFMELEDVVLVNAGYFISWVNS